MTDGCVLERSADESILNALIRNGEAAQEAFVQKNDPRGIAEVYAAWMDTVQSRLKTMKDKNVTPAEFDAAQATSFSGAPDHHDATGSAIWSKFEVKIAVLKSYSKALNREMCDAELMERPNGSKD
jgi:hypothetical protein